MHISTKIAVRDLSRSHGAGTTPAPHYGLAALDPARPPAWLRPNLEGAAGHRVLDTVAVLRSGEQVAITVGLGEAVGLVGPAGSGKTRLVQSLSGLFSLGEARPTTSRAVLVAEDVTVNDDLTVADTVAYWAGVPHHQPAPTVASEQLVSGVVEATGLGRWLDTPVGECYQVVHCALAVGVALLARPAVLIVDDPLRKIAARQQPWMLALFTALQRHQIGLVYATRLEAEAAALCSRIVRLPTRSDVAATSRAG